MDSVPLWGMTHARIPCVAGDEMQVGVGQVRQLFSIEVVIQVVWRREFDAKGLNCANYEVCVEFEVRTQSFSHYFFCPTSRRGPNTLRNSRRYRAPCAGS